MILKRMFVLPAICLALPAGVLAQPFQAEREAIRKHMQANGVPGIAVAVWQDGKIVWEEGFGWADMENRIPVNAHSVFNLASVSKSLTAVGVMTLVEKGKVNLDGPSNDYLGEDRLRSWIGDPQQVTVRRLLNHTSGLPGGDQTFFGEDMRNMPSESEAIRRYGIVVAPAGERYLYSNIGYGVLGHLIAQVSGKSFADYMRQDVFLPLGMTHSSVEVAPGLEKYEVARYDYDRKRIPAYGGTDQGAGSVYASVHDLARMGLFMLKTPLPDQRAILNDASIDRLSEQPADEASSPVRVAAPNGTGYAQGWGVSTRGSYRVIGHAGSHSGVSTNFRLVPSRRVGVAVLANADGGAGKLTDVLLKSVLKDWQDPAPASAPAVQPFKPAAELVGNWQGTVHTYQGQLPIKLSVQPSGDVHVRIGGEPRFGNRSSVRQEALLNDVKFVNGTLTGNTLAQIETADTKRHAHVTELRLKLRGDVLNGAASANSVFEGFWVYSLPHWVELTRSP
ncbi:serine hydrolase domain-containing protein [Steroidobacter sp.]|uniref:serine hydrolase domain-containing protein n=1 Tax=Steroidobacter sp. TaxID=1978227 RepID=UPI001A422B2E|nr:serine hydrolase domain-containing protein [Steroidobacter sp.]MBL8267912.1 beta-lactamase family protein [Steroidobacter sp.]